MGVNLKAVSWIKTFLQERNQSVVVEGKQFPLVPVMSGVPQGSVLGPCLFLSYINDLSGLKHIPSKTSCSVYSVPWITPEIRRKIRRTNATRTKAKKAGSAKIRFKFETLRREIKADIRKQHDLYVNNLV